MAAVKTEAAGSPQLRLSETNINWDRLDKTRFHVIGAVLFTAQASLVHPMMLIKTRMQVAEDHYKHVSGISLFRNVLKTDGIRGLYRGFGTGATGAIPGRVLSLTSLEVSKDLVLKSTKSLDMPEASRIALANGVGGMMSTIISCVYFVPLEVVCQRLMVQGLPGSTMYNGPYDVIGKVYKAEGFRGFYRGFGMSIVTQSPASALWWSAYSTSQHLMWRGLGYEENEGKSPSHMEMVSVQATAGTIAGAFSTVLTTPFDTIKTRLQVMDNYGGGRPSVSKTAKTLFEEDGWRGFYRGFGPRFLSMSFWGTSMIVTYELIKRLSVRKT